MDITARRTRMLCLRMSVQAHMQGMGGALLVKCLQSQHEGMSSPVPMSKPGVVALVCYPNERHLEFICQSAEMIYELQV